MERNKYLFLSGKYEIERIVKEDSYSRVLIARHNKLQILRVIKQIYKETPFSKDLSNEAYLMKNLHHRAFPLVIDFEEDETSFYLVEEFVDGETLSEYLLRQKSISLNFLNQIMDGVCACLEYLHSLCPPVIYNDLKPEHIFLCDGFIRVIDFGAARAIGDTCRGFTPQFAAPENLSGQNGTIQSDIYMLGALLQDLSTHLPEIPIRISKTINRSMKYEPAERFASVRDFLISLSEDTMIKRQEKHLLKKIAVIGTKPGVGTTHIAVSLACAGSFSNCNSYYFPGGNNDGLREIPAITKDLNIIFEDDVIPDTAQSLFIDKGAFDKKVELDACDSLVLVTGFKSWEKEQSLRIIETLSRRKNFYILCNYGDKSAAREISRLTNKRVFIFPLDEDPYRVTEDKVKLFKLLQK